MISDTLSTAVHEIDQYLKETPDVYKGNLRKAIEKVRDDMEAIKNILDLPPEIQNNVDWIGENDTGMD